MLRRRIALGLSGCAVFFALQGLEAGSLPRQVPGASPPGPTGLVVGQVVDADSGQPIAGAQVSLRPPAPDEASGAAAQPVAPPQVLRVETSAEGQFVLHNLAAGRLVISVTAPGYLPGSPGQRRPGGPSVPPMLAEGQHLTQVVIRMWKYAVMAGRVIDERGEPLVGVSVRALRRSGSGGRARLVASVSVNTDDRGQFRIGRLTPGAYHLAVASTQLTMPVSLVAAYQQLSDQGDTDARTALSRQLSASGSPLPIISGLVMGDHVLQGGSTSSGPPLPAGFESRPAVYLSQFTPELDRDPITLESGEVRQNVELALQLVPAVSVSGTLVGPDGPVAHLGVQLVSRALAGVMGRGLETARTATDANGGFTFLGVPAGEYELSATLVPRPSLQPTMSTTLNSASGGMTIIGSSVRSGAPPDDPTLFASQALTVGADDVTGILVQVREGPRVSGTAVFAGDGELPAPEFIERIRVRLQPVTDELITQVAAPINADGTFRTMGFPAGRYFVTAQVPSAEWLLASATVGGRDVSIHPLELESTDVTTMMLTFTNRRTMVSGAVRTAAAVAPESQVIIVPADMREWMAEGMNPARFRVTQPAATGLYEVSGLHPGEYRIVATDDIALDASSLEVLEAVGRLGLSVSLREGQRVTLDLRTISTLRAPDIQGPTFQWVAAGGPAAAVPPQIDGPDDPDADRPHGPRVLASSGESRGLAQVVHPGQARDVAVPSPVGTGLIAGVVVADDGQGRPLGRASVALSSSMLRPGRLATTNDRGEFVFTGLPAGRFTLTVRKPPYVDTAYGGTRPGRPGSPIALTDGQQMTGLTLRMTPGAVLEGILRDEFGQPLQGVRVMALQRRTAGGALQYVRAGSSLLVSTDDRGLYRIWGLPPGDYVIGVTESQQPSHRVTDEEVRWAMDAANPLSPPRPPPAQGPDLGDAPVYFPGVTDPAGAQTVTLRAGDELTGLDFAVTAVPIVAVTGRLLGPDGAPPGRGRAQLSVVPSEGLTTPFLTRPLFGAPMPDGTFSFKGLTPGRYTMVAQASSSQTPASGPARPGASSYDLWARHEFDVMGQDIGGVILTLAEGLHVRGRVVFEQTTADVPEDLSRVSIRVLPVLTTGVSLGTTNTTLNPDGTFDIAGVPPDNYRVSVSAPGRTETMPTWSLKSVVVRGQDVTDTPLVVQGSVDDVTVTMTDRRTMVTGHLKDSAGRPAPEYSILVFPVDPAHWYRGSRRRPSPTRPDSSGAFRVALPPGTYYMAALTTVEQDELYDTDFLESLIPASLKITVAEGEEKVQDLQLAGGGR